MKKCKYCDKVQPLASHFYKDSSMKDGYSNKCRICNKESSKRWGLTQQGKEAKYARGVTKYGLTIEQYEEMLQSQNGVCAICFTTGKSSKRLGVDHCHETGKIRGLLCANCNTAIGLLGDKPELLVSAVRYLK